MSVFSNFPFDAIDVGRSLSVSRTMTRTDIEAPGYPSGDVAVMESLQGRQRPLRHRHPGRPDGAAGRGDGRDGQPGLHGSAWPKFDVRIQYMNSFDLGSRMFRNESCFRQSSHPAGALSTGPTALHE